MEWSNSSTIFAAHPTQPLLTARHFSSSKKFVVPSPTSIINSPASYLPPTVISVSPTDDWLFAYFPGRHSDGLGCLWQRGLQIDGWTVKEWWGIARDAGVVTASWLGTPREVRSPEVIFKIRRSRRISLSGSQILRAPPFVYLLVALASRCPVLPLHWLPRTINLLFAIFALTHLP